MLLRVRRNLTPRMPKAPIRLGLTGGIASGKSAVSRLLVQSGIPVVDADEVYHDLVRTHTGLREDLVEAFGSEVFLENGELNRPWLGQLVFRDPKARATLGSLTHPRVREGLVTWMREQAETSPPPPAVCAAIPLLFENGLETLFDQTLLIAVSPETQKARLMERDGFAASEANRRIQSQMPLVQKQEKADRILWNEGTLEDTQHALEKLLQEMGLSSP